MVADGLSQVSGSDAGGVAVSRFRNSATTRSIGRSGVWDEVYHHYLAAKPMPVIQAVRGKAKQSMQKAA